MNTALPTGAGRKGGLSLVRGGFVDIEEIMTKERIRTYLMELEGMEANDYIKWFSKGTKPTMAQVVPRPAFTPNPVGSTVAPPNEFDAKLNALLEEERKRDERTLPSELGRVTEQTYGEIAGVDAAAERARIQKDAALEAKEKALADKERELKEREDKLASGRRGRGRAHASEANVGAGEDD